MEQISFEDASANKNESASDLFGVCSRYRECSDAKRCLIDDRDYSQSCQYRKNLESGIIYYGKNAVGFSKDEYEEYLNTISGLSDEEHLLFETIVLYMCGTMRNTQMICVYRAQTIDELSRKGLVDISTGNEYLLNRYKAKNIESILDGYPEKAAQWEKDKVKLKETAKKENKKFVLRDEFAKWALKNAQQAVESIGQKYVFVSFSGSKRKYAEEYFHDYKLYDRKSEIPLPKFPLDEEPIFLKNV